MNWFSPPVPVSGKPGRVNHINSAERALEELRAWNLVGSKRWRTAFEVCVAIDGQATAADARKAFIAAAKAAGRLIVGVFVFPGCRTHLNPCLRFRNRWLLAIEMSIFLKR